MLHSYKCFQRSRTVLLVCIIHKKCFCEPGHITQFLNVLVADSLKASIRFAQYNNSSALIQKNSTTLIYSNRDVYTPLQEYFLADISSNLTEYLA